MDTRIIRISEVLSTLSLTKPDVMFLAVATTKLGPVGAKRTRKCFAGPRWVSRDETIDKQFPISQPRAGACVITTLAPSQEWTFREASAAVLGLREDINTGLRSIGLLGRLLIQHRNTLTLAQFEKMAEDTAAMCDDEYANMRVDGLANFAFVETGDKNNPVAVMEVCRRAFRSWATHVRVFGDGSVQNRGDRLIVPDLVF